MSLKYFHIIFLGFAFLFDAGFWLWMHLLPEDAALAGALSLKPFAGILCLLILVYAFWYLVRKMRTIIV